LVGWDRPTHENWQDCPNALAKGLSQVLLTMMLQLRLLHLQLQLQQLLLRPWSFPHAPLRLEFP
jgi:hypothetical protein